MTPLPSDEVDLHDADPDWLNLFFAVGTDAWYRWSIPSKPVSHVELRWCTSWFHGDCSIQHHKLLSECQRRHLYYCSTIYLLSKTFRSCTFVRNIVQVSIILDQRQHFRGRSFAVLFFPSLFPSIASGSSWRWRSLRSIRHSVAVKVKFGIVSMATGARDFMTARWDWSNFPNCWYSK